MTTMMRIRRILNPTLMLALIYLAVFFPVSQGASLPLPLPKGELVSLNGSNRLVLPDYLRGKKVLIAFGFHPRHQSVLEKGMVLFEGLRSSTGPVQVLEVAVIDPKYKAFKPSVEAYMRKTVNEKRLMGRIYPFYTDSQQVKRSLGLRTEEYSFVLVGPEGQVLWKKSEIPTAAMVESVNRLLP